LLHKKSERDFTSTALARTRGALRISMLKLGLSISTPLVHFQVVEVPNWQGELDSVE
jgi:hypothetical protein